MIKGVIFDLGRVLVGINPAGGLRAHPSLSPDMILEWLASEEFMAYNAGRMEPEAFHRAFCDRYRIEIDFAGFRIAWCGIFISLEPMREIAEQVAARYPVGLLSDTDPLHWEQIGRQFPWIPAMFPHAALSYRLGSLKPSRENYLAACKQVRLLPQECLFIDDLEKNVVGAREAGMEAIRFENPIQLRNALVSLGILST